MPQKVKKTTSRRGGGAGRGPEAGQGRPARGEDLTDPDGLLKSITATVLETALAEELTEHPGHEKRQALAAESGIFATAPGPRRCWPMLPGR